MPEQPPKAIILFTPENILEAINTIREIYTKYGHPLTNGCFLDLHLKEMEKYCTGVKAFNPELHQEIAYRIFWQHMAGLTIIYYFAKDLKICIEKNIPLESKLKASHKQDAVANTTHEIHDLACLLRAGKNAKFVSEGQEQTPDIEIVGEGVLECKTVTSERGIKDELVKASKQMKNFSGVKVTDFYLYSPLSIEEDYLKDLWKRVFLEKKRDLQKVGAFDGFSFSYMKASITQSVSGYYLKSDRFVVGNNQTVHGILSPLVTHSL